MGNSTSRGTCCFLPKRERAAVGAPFSEPLDEGLGHSFCYVRPPFQSSSSSNSSSNTTETSFSLPSDEFLPPPLYSHAIYNPKQLHDHLQNPTTNGTVKNKIFPEKSFKSISGASVSANTSNPRSLLSHEQFNSFPIIPSDRAAAFESTASFSHLPLQPLPKGVPFSGSVSGPLSMSGPLERGVISGSLDRGFMSGPLERGFMSGPLERIHVSGSLDPIDRNIFSAPLGIPYSGYIRRRKKFLARFVKTLSKSVKKALRKTLSSALLKNILPARTPPKRFNPGDDGAHEQSSQEVGYCSAELDNRAKTNLQWAQAMAGEDRVHIVLSEEHGWLFVGIYDGFNGPDAPDFLMSNLYPEINRELQGLLSDRTDSFESSVTDVAQLPKVPKVPKVDHRRRKNQKRVSAHEILGILDSWQKDISDKKRGGESRDKNDTEVRVNKKSQILDGQKNSVEIASDKNNSDQPVSMTQGASQIENDIESSIRQIDAGNYPVLASEERPDRQFADNRPDGEHAGLDLAEDASRTLRELPDRQRKNVRQLLQWRHNQDLATAEVHESNATKEAEYRKRHRHSSVDHGAVLRALSRALKATEEAYLDMADKAVADNPELALVGSCVLVMVMKDEDVYIMNVGDSRALLAQQASTDSFDFSSFLSRGKLHGQLNGSKEDYEWIVARDSMLRMELERIIEETPTELEALEQAFDPTEMAPPPISSTLDALQLTSDHSTSIQQEVQKLMMEHPDDDAPIFNDRVKGRLKVTRAFGAGFLKKPKWNDALLEMFRIDYIGTAPYISCTPAMYHHKLGPQDRFLVLSSDGLYQYLTNEEVISHVEWFMEKFPEGDPAQYLIEELLFRAAKKAGMDFHELLEIPQGDRRKYHDDVSVMVISVEGRVWRSFS
ncbi:hypothetical protein O6H91_18G077100 [Diphasiastrum complanatum]|uniref:Uncharacterized protein n=1 Tax=Diphasiastrum complanatum TaxID=34168 RepID=A0ACC2B2U5_DIPCM|nr:hypothetical protein O6H91_18G077100 [Diphasiastrum complanatum]